jgi:hypothetical protein
MAALPASNTARAWLDYSDGVNEHSMMFRFGPSVTQLTINSRIDTFLDSLDTVLYLITVIGLRLAVAGSNVTNPASWTGNATYGTGTMPVSNAPRELRFIGRSTDGRQNSVSVYGFDGATPDTYRITSAANPVIEAAILSLANSAAVGVGLTVSGQPPIWKAYASFNFNSYWEKEARP